MQFSQVLSHILIHLVLSAHSSAFYPSKPSPCPNLISPPTISRSLSPLSLFSLVAFCRLKCYHPMKHGGHLISPLDTDPCIQAIPSCGWIPPQAGSSPEIEHVLIGVDFPTNPTDVPGHCAPTQRGNWDGVSSGVFVWIPGSPAVGIVSLPVRCGLCLCIVMVEPRPHHNFRIPGCHTFLLNMTDELTLEFSPV